MAYAGFMKKAYVDTDSGQIHYRYTIPSSLDKGEAVLLLHKSASSSASYETIAANLVSEGYTCYAPDMPGFGGSFDPSRQTIDDIEQRGTRFYVDLFFSAFTSLGVFGVGGKPFHIMGHHSGACLAMEMAAVYPEHVASITLVGPSVMSPEVRAEMKKNYYDAFNKPTADGSHLQKTWDYLRHMGVGDDIDLFQREAIDHIRAWRGRQLIYGSVWSQDMEACAKAVQCPVLLVCAKDDVLWAHFEEARQVWPTAETLECKGANFSLDLDAESIGVRWLGFVSNGE